MSRGIVVSGSFEGDALPYPFSWANLMASSWIRLSGNATEYSYSRWQDLHLMRVLCVVVASATALMRSRSSSSVKALPAGLAIARLPDAV